MKNKIEYVRVGDVLRLERRRVDIDPLTEYSLIGVCSLGKGIFHREPQIGTELGNYTFDAIRADDLVLSNIQAREGAIALAGDAENGCIATHRFLTYVPRDQRVSTAYLRYYFLSERGLDLIRKASPGSVVRNRTLGIDAFESLEIPLPSPDEQRGVVASIERLRGGVERLRHVSDVSADELLARLPRLSQHVLDRYAEASTPVGDLVENVADVVRPGDDPGAADVFVGLQHIEPHTGRRLGQDAVGGGKGRKFRFAPGDIVYGYLRPYLNKVWVADTHGLCSVDQYVLRPREGVRPHLLAASLRSAAVLESAKELTHSLQLPRLRLGLLSSIDVPRVPAHDAPAVEQSLRRLTTNVSELAQLKRRHQQFVDSLEPAVVNYEIKNAICGTR